MLSFSPQVTHSDQDISFIDFKSYFKLLGITLQVACLIRETKVIRVTRVTRVTRVSRVIRVTKGLTSIANAAYSRATTNAHTVILCNSFTRAELFGPIFFPFNITLSNAISLLLNII